MAVFVDSAKTGYRLTQLPPGFAMREEVQSRKFLLDAEFNS